MDSRNHRQRQVHALRMMVLLTVAMILTFTCSKWRPTPDQRPVPFLNLSRDVSEALISSSTISGESLGPQIASYTKEDVLLSLKTGAMVLWDRLPVHLATTFSSNRLGPHVIYSDLPQKIGKFEVIDVFENISRELRSSPAFERYDMRRRWHDTDNYFEESVMDKYRAGHTEGWTLDKHKFIPILEHAWRNWPKQKWYIFMEADSYMFFPNVLKWLGQYDYREPYYFGRHAIKSGTLFAHGGAGYILSHGAVKKFMDRFPNPTRLWESYTEEHGWGDQVLGEALVESGIILDIDGRWVWGFEDEPHWQIQFQKWQKCQPIFSMHHLRPHEIASYWDLEQEWNFEQVCSNLRPHSLPVNADFALHKSLQYKHIFRKLIQPYLRRHLEYWDNFSSEIEVDSGTNSSRSESPNAWASPNECEAACSRWEDCRQWAWYEDHCKLDSRVYLGKTKLWDGAKKEWEKPFVSGWMLERIESEWGGEDCPS